jgi:NB-ARC domain
MTSFARLQAVFAAFTAGRATPEETSVLREAIATGQVQILTGERAIQFGRDANGATVVTGDRNVVISVGPGDVAALLKTLAAQGRPSPNQLPADLPDFQGREDQVARLRAILRGGSGRPAIAAITGMGGVGKSALALHVAHLIVDETPDGRIFVDLGGTSPRPLTPVDAMVRVVAALAPTMHVPKEEHAAAQAYRTVLDGKRVLLLLDNADDSAQVRPLLDWRTPPTMVLVTSRRVIAAPGLQTINLDAMDADEARALLREVLGERETSDYDLDALASRCGYLPLALRVAGSFLLYNPNWTIYRYLNALTKEEKQPVLSRISHATKDAAAVVDLTEQNIAGTRRETAERLRRLARMPTSFDEISASELWQCSPNEARTILTQLTQSSLLSYDPYNNRYRIHKVVRENIVLHNMRDDAKERKIFICYAKEDEVRATELFNRLVAEGFEVWMDKKAFCPELLGNAKSNMQSRLPTLPSFFCRLSQLPNEDLFKKNTR